MANSDEGKWLRKATLCEQIYELGHQNGVYLTHYTLDLESKMPITEDIMRQALVHLYRKVPVLRLCLRERDSELWIREMDDCVLDLEIIDEGDVEMERNKMTLHTYNAFDGPLWCVRLVSQTKGSTGLSQSRGEGKDFTFNYSVIFGIHHSVSDGSTNVKICNLLRFILDSIMIGDAIDDDVQLGEITDDKEMCALLDREMAKLKNDPDLCSKIKRELAEGSSVRPLIRHICRIPSDTVIMSRNVTLTVDSATTNMFLKKARSEGVTLHSAITGVINVSLLDLIKEAGIHHDEYVFRAGHDIDVRRYFVNDASHMLGIYGPVFGYRYSFVVPKDLLSTFWDNVRRFHQHFKIDVAEGAVLTTSAYRLMTEDFQASLKDLFRTAGEPNYYYTISNMGNLSGSLSEEAGRVVTIGKLTRFSSIRNGISFMCIYIHTFRDQLNISFSYSTKFLSHDFVQKLADLVKEHMDTVCTL
ncbi:hypothetical protein SK128_002760 [Halocaridina rubra]|uniref:Alcohol acetyltransferase n=1 Tax=Halocaridina rubra TaxID=373956 RepID=A0AAN9A1Y6_HALRR